MTPASAVVDTLRAAGADVQEIGGRRHAKIRWSFNGRKMQTVVARTPSCPRTIRNSVALARRQLREAREGVDA